MEYRVLGPIEVLEGDRRLDLGGPKPRALLAVLLFAADRVVPQSELLEALWPEGAPATAGTAVQVYVSRLRKTLPENTLETRQPGYVVHVGPGELDLERFELLARQGQPREALSLWRGPPAEGLQLGGWARAEIHRLAELHLSVLEDAVEADLELGRHAELVGELQALVERHPLRERLRGQLMLALYRSGRQAEALEQYRLARAALSDELGLEPGSELQRLHTAMLRQEPDIEVRRGLATVLFAILTPVGEADAFTVRDALARAAEAATAELQQAGADVERGLAGALLARFDSGPSAAVAAARALCDRLAGSPVRARIGIETGELLTGPGGLTGTPVAVASKLAGAAEPGEILLGEVASGG